MKAGDLVRRKTQVGDIRKKIHIIIKTQYNGRFVFLTDTPTNQVFSPNSLELVSAGR